MSHTAAYGARFLAEIRRQRLPVGSWTYAELQAIERADRDQLIGVLRRRNPLLTYAAIQRIQSQEPEELVVYLMEQQRLADTAHGRLGANLGVIDLLLALLG